MLWGVFERKGSTDECNVGMVSRKRVVVMVHWASLPLSNIYQFVEALYYARLAIPRQVHAPQQAHPSMLINEVPTMQGYVVVW